MDSDSKKRVTVILPADLHKKLKHLAVEEDCSIQDLYLKAIRELMRRS